MDTVYTAVVAQVQFQVILGNLHVATVGGMYGIVDHIFIKVIDLTFCSVGGTTDICNQWSFIATNNSGYASEHGTAGCQHCKHSTKVESCVKTFTYYCLLFGRCSKIPSRLSFISHLSWMLYVQHYLGSS